MGHKLHLDQNEKLGMFGVTHVLAVDGYSSKTVAHSTMPVKNNLVIYEDVYRCIQVVVNIHNYHYYCHNFSVLHYLLNTYSY